MSENFRNILITKPSSLGDIVLALPALRALRMSFPEARISWLIRPEFAPLIENHPHLDEIITFDRKLLGKAWFHPGAFGALMSLIRKIRRSSFDVIFDFQGLFRTASLAWLSGCKKRFGMANAREFATIFYTHKIPQNIEDIHMLGSLEFAKGVKGTKLLVVMGHTSCGAVAGACQNVKLGSLTQLLSDIRPAVEVVQMRHPGEDVCRAPHVDEISRENVLRTVKDITEKSTVIAELVAAGKLKVVGAMYDITTGEVTWL